MTGFLHQPPQQQLFLILYSLILGMSIGVIYTLFDTISIMLNLYIDDRCIEKGRKQQRSKNKIIISKIFQFSIDFLFSIVYTVIVVVFIFCANNGKFRFFIMLFSVLGFVLYKTTLGKAVHFLIYHAFRYLKMAVSAVVISPLARTFRFLEWKICAIRIKRRILNSVSKDRDF